MARLLSANPHKPANLRIRGRLIPPPNQSRALSCFQKSSAALQALLRRLRGPVRPRRLRTAPRRLGAPLRSSCHCHRCSGFVRPPARTIARARALGGAAPCRRPWAAPHLTRAAAERVKIHINARAGELQRRKDGDSEEADPVETPRVQLRTACRRYALTRRRTRANLLAAVAWRRAAALRVSGGCLAPPAAFVRV